MQLFIQPCCGSGSAEEEEGVAFCFVCGTSEEQPQSEASVKFLVCQHFAFRLVPDGTSAPHLPPPPLSIQSLLMSKIALEQ